MALYQVEKGKMIPKHSIEFHGEAELQKLIDANLKVPQFSPELNICQENGSK